MQDELGVVGVVCVLNGDIQRVAECFQCQFRLGYFITIPSLCRDTAKIARRPGFNEVNVQDLIGQIKLAAPVEGLEGVRQVEPGRAHNLVGSRNFRRAAAHVLDR